MSALPLTDSQGAKRAYALAGLGMLLLLAGSYWGLFVAPVGSFMGDVQRIMYVHVPTAWNAMLALTFAFGCALVFLTAGAGSGTAGWKRGWKWVWCYRPCSARRGRSGPSRPGASGGTGTRASRPRR